MLWFNKTTHAIVTTLTATPTSAAARNRWQALSIAESTPLRLTVTILGMSQRVIWIATAICGLGNPCAMSGTYHWAVKKPTIAQLVRTIARRLSVVLARR